MKWIALIGLPLALCCKPDEPTDDKPGDCTERLKQIELLRDTTITLTYGQEAQLIANEPISIKFSDAFLGCSLDQCSYCDIESKVRLEVRSSGCVDKVTPFVFLKCDNSSKLNRPDFKDCKWPYETDTYNASGPFFTQSVYGLVMFALVEFSPYAATIPFLVKEWYLSEWHHFVWLLTNKVGIRPLTPKPYADTLPKRYGANSVPSISTNSTPNSPRLVCR
jgi:hypothetical protein